jgi:hypothetical protein
MRALLVAAMLSILFSAKIVSARVLQSDVNRDGIVNFADFLVLAGEFGLTGDPAFCETDTIAITLTDTVFVPDDRGLIIGSHTEEKVFWLTDDGRISADVKWRYISWNSIYRTRDESNVNYTITIAKLTFKDKDGFQIGEYDPLFTNVDRFTLNSHQTITRQGSFEVEFPSLPHANQVAEMSLWLGI